MVEQGFATPHQTRDEQKKDNVVLDKVSLQSFDDY